MPNKPVYLFLLEAFIWLPITFFIWYYFASVLTVPVAFLVRLFLTNLWPSWIEGIEQHGHLLEVTTSITLSINIAVPDGAEALFAFDVNPLIYGYGLPFLMALTFAVPNTVSSKLRQVSLAWLLVLLPVQTFCVMTLILKVLIFQTEPSISFQIASSDWSREAIALAFQFGSLILPPVTPLLIWIFLNQNYLQVLSKRRIGLKK
jgi:hypothetical protein